MIIEKTIRQTRKIISQARAQGQTIGLVPTMGALHKGHLSLIRRCRAECDFAAVSIFVNPTQFAPTEDLAAYPRTLDADTKACRELGVDLVFAPEPAEMYPQPNLTWINVEDLTNHLCGATRPTHFRGVCTVVAKLFNILTPDHAYFGQKDAQQLAVIQRMTADLNMPVKIHPCPIVREPDGLAMSSRNQYLNPEQRRQALCLHRALQRALELFQDGTRQIAPLIQAARQTVQEQPEAKIDYISIVDKDLMTPIPQTIQRPALMALAVHIANTRLIDNIVLDPTAG